MQKKKLIIIAAAAVVAAIISVIVIKKVHQKPSDPNETAYVQSISEITSEDEISGIFNHFSGTVETQEEVKINKDQDAKVKVKVKAGDEVKKGDVLFSYDVEEYKSKLEQAKIELERLNTELDSAKRTVEELNREKAKADTKSQGNYTLQIEEEELGVKEKEYEIKAKKKEIKSLKKSLKNTDIKSEIDGVIKSVNDENNEDPYSMDQESALIVITQKGDYRVKGTVNEQNVQQLSVGTNVIVRSRINPEEKWKGSITKIDTDNKEKSNSDDYFDMGSESGSTSYPFYVELDNNDGLMLGQHVYMEVDYGQADAGSREGIWIPEYYIDQTDIPFVWADDNGKLIKKSVELGEYDENLMEFQVVSGITEEDKIAMPEEYLREGMQTAPAAEKPQDFDESEDSLTTDDAFGEDDGDSDEDFSEEDDSDEYIEDDTLVDDETYDLEDDQSAISNNQRIQEQLTFDGTGADYEG